VNLNSSLEIKERRGGSASYWLTGAKRALSKTNISGRDSECEGTENRYCKVQTSSDAVGGGVVIDRRRG